MRLIETLVDILRIESFTGNERRLCDFIATEIERRFAGVASRPTVERINQSLVVRAPHRPGRPTLGLAGHLDTVTGVETGERVRTEGDRIIGLGASDMKAGVAVMLELLSPEHLARLNSNLTWIFYEAEEGALKKNGLHALLASLPHLKAIELCFILEPTDGTLHLGCMGSNHAKVTFTGRRAHSARPWQGENAIHKAAGFLSRLNSQAPRRVVVEGLPFQEVMSATIAHSGDNPSNVVPDTFEVGVNTRFAPGTSLAAARAWLETVVAGEASIEVTNESPPGPIPAGGTHLTRFRTMFQLPEHPKQAYTDVALLGLHQIPAVNCGPGITAQAHQRGEYVLASEVIRSFELYRRFFTDTTAPGGPA